MTPSSSATLVLQWVGAALAIVTSILLIRVVLHGYTDHGHLDVFHLVVALALATVGLLLVLRALPSRT